MQSATYRHDLYVVENVLGDAKIWTRVAGVTFGRAGIGTVLPTELPWLARRIDHLNWAYCDVHFAFDLEELPTGQTYENATIRARFDHSDVIAVHLEPAADSGAAFGYGSNTARWRLAADDGTRVTPRGRAVRAIVQRPIPLAEVDVELDAEVTFVRTVLRRFERRTATFQNPIRYRLSFQDGSFVPVQD